MPAHQKAPRTPAKNKQNAPPPLPPPPTPSLAAKPNFDQPRSVSPVKGKPPSPSSQPPLTLKATPAPLQEYKQIQDDEVEALKSIFMEDYQHVQNSGAWNTSNPSFKLRLKAESDADYYCILSVKMTATYPKSLPELQLTPAPKIKEWHVKKLKDVLKTVPRERIGQEMIFDIATAIQDLLEDIVQNRIADMDKPSLGEERALKVQDEKKRAEEEQAELLQKQHEAEMAQQQELQKMIDLELKRQAEQAQESADLQRKNSLMEADKYEGAEDCVNFDRTISIPLPDGGGLCVFRTVCGMVKMSEGPIMTVYTVRPAGPAHQSKNIPLVLKELELPDSFEDCQEGKRQIRDLEQELEVLKTLKHPNVMQLYESQVSKDRSIPITSPGSCSNGGWKITILTEYANKGSLYDLLETAETIKVETARLWTISLLDGLDYIHRQGAVHGDIHVGNILLTRRSRVEPTVAKLADVSYMKSIHDILKRGHNFIGHAKAASWFPPEMSYTHSSDPSVRKTTRKSDIWNLGIVFLQMLFGLKILETYDSPQKLLDSMELSESLSDFLESVFRPDPKKRPTAFELLPSEFLRNDDPITPRDHDMRAPSPAISRHSWRGNTQNRYNSRTRNGSFGVSGGPSRYAADFLEVSRLGKGGYGQVVKARNRLDGREYAIKIITQNSGPNLREILGEVMLLSRLNHQYVVRYYTAWLETEDVEKPEFGDSETEDDGDDTSAITDSSGSDTTRSGNSARTTEGVNQDASIVHDISGVDVEFSQGLDFISSYSGHPKIQFGDDSESEEESEDSSENDESEEEEDEDDEDTESQIGSKEMALKRINSHERKGKKVTLYIQMSLAERQTLRDRIQQGLGLEESWKLLRQILEGLAHIHGLGIIHRDLKPENIFIDSAGDPQIGDFGLATNDLVINANPEKADVNADNELTTNVGTTLYVAPELRDQAKGIYNEKVDMYSLGIIFFEMCYPLNSGMERVHVLTALREPSITFPPEFFTEKRQDQAEIIRSLLSHDPSNRPTPVELLNSGKIPFMIEERVIRQALASLSDPNMAGHQQVMQALFSAPTEKYKDHTYDLDPNHKLPTWNQLLLQSQVKETLTSIFRHHGAVETTRQLFMPRNRVYSRDVVPLIDSNGTLLQLPYDLTLPHARFLARDQSPAQKTYTFGTVYRKNPIGGHPRAVCEVDFDIISDDTLDQCLKEAEVIKVLDEIVDTFPSLSTAKIAFHINHSSLLDAIMEFCRIAPPQRGPAKEILSKLNIGDIKWPQIRKELATAGLGILPTSLDDLARFDWRDEQEKALRRLGEIFEGSSVGKEWVAGVGMHLRGVVEYVRRFGVKRKVLVCPLGTFNEKYYSGGVMFQGVVERGRKRVVWAAGGRYDSLIAALKPKLTPDTPHAVGCNIGWEQLCTSMSIYLEKLSTKSKSHKNSLLATPAVDVDPTLDLPWSPRRVDVLITSFDTSTLRTLGISLLANLWAAGISAELAPSPGDLAATTTELNGVGWVVFLKHNAGARIKAVHHKTPTAEVEMKTSDVIGYLKGEIADREKRVNHSMVSHGSPLLQRLSSTDTQRPILASLNSHHHHNHGDENTPPLPDVRVLASDRKGRKLTRGNVIEHAQRALLQGAAEVGKMTVAAIDVDAEVLDAVRRTPVGDVEGWRRLVQSVPASERRYLGEVGEFLRGLREEGRGEGGGKDGGRKEVWLWSFRAGVGGVVYLG